MPEMVCRGCGQRRQVADYISRLPLRCTGCGGTVAIPEENPVAVPSPLNGRPEMEDDSTSVFTKTPLPIKAESRLDSTIVPLAARFEETPQRESEPEPSVPDLSLPDLSLPEPSVPELSVPELSVAVETVPDAATALEPVALASAPSLEAVPELSVPSIPEAAPPSESVIALTPDRDLTSLIVSELPGVPLGQIHSPSMAVKPPDRDAEGVAEQSRLAERLKEIASLPPPPKAEPDPAPAVDAFVIRPYLEPAAAWKRFVARCIANGLGYLAFIAGIGFQMTMFRVGILNVNSDPMLRTVLTFVPLALYLFIHMALLSSRGQDVGKMLLRIRVVKDDGSPAGLKRAFLIREVGFQLIPIGMIIAGAALARLPAIGLFGYGLAFVAIVFPLIDAISVLSSPGRSMHDQLAGTQVVEGGPASA